MHIESKIMSSTVMNIVQSSCSLSEVHTYICDHIEEWNKLDVDECWDLTKMDFGFITPKAIKSFVAETIKLSQQRVGKKAAIIVNNYLSFGMMRMLQILSDDKFKNTLKIFRSENEALEWLRRST